MSSSIQRFEKKKKDSDEDNKNVEDEEKKQRMCITLIHNIIHRNNDIFDPEI